jgi:hypothetical protein
VCRARRSDRRREKRNFELLGRGGLAQFGRASILSTVLCTVALDHPSGEERSRFRGDPLFENLSKFLAQIRGFVHAREFEGFKSCVGTVH